MHYYDNAKGDRCRVSITVATLQRLKSSLDIDLINDPASFPTDLAKSIDMLWVIEHGGGHGNALSPGQFAETLTGEALAKAMEAAVLELSLFFSAFNPVAGQVIKIGWEASQTMSEAHAKRIGAAVGALCTELQERSE